MFGWLAQTGTNGGKNSPIPFGVVPEGERVYAVGDIHGCFDQLNDLLEKMKGDAKNYTGKVYLVFIGDYIDRGPHSREVVTALCHPSWPKEWSTVFIRGNHEQGMLDFLANPGLQPEWLNWGGRETLASYGISTMHQGRLRTPESLAPELEEALQDAGHMSFFKATVLQHILGGYAFVHAGVRAGVPMHRQIPNDLLFIREDFIGRDHGLPTRVVFGHTIQRQGHQVWPQPLITPDRIGIDTGAYDGGPLTAVRLEGSDVHILQAGSRA